MDSNISLYCEESLPSLVRTLVRSTFDIKILWLVKAGYNRSAAQPADRPKLPSSGLEASAEHYAAHSFQSQLFEVANRDHKFLIYARHRPLRCMKRLRSTLLPDAGNMRSRELVGSRRSCCSRDDQTVATGAEWLVTVSMLRI